MIFMWLRARRRRRILAQPFPDQWESVLSKSVSFWPQLTSGERQKLKDDVQVFVAEKRWESTGGLELTDKVKVTIAGAACVLLLGLDYDLYRNVKTILVYPSDYEATWEKPIHGDITPEDPEVRLGEAHYRGPVLLSWDSVRHGVRHPRDGHNLVYHEFAHKLDMSDGLIDGTPPLTGDKETVDWAEVMTSEYERLCDRVDRGRATLLDSYGATDSAEFFAVATEVFFEKPAQMRKVHPGLYEVLRGFYKQDPAGRLQTLRQEKKSDTDLH